MVFIESPVFTRQVLEALSDEAYAESRQRLAARRQPGEVIPSSGGLRKMRWSIEGRGTRGGVRVIYFQVTAQARCRMLLIYRKGTQDGLSAPKEKMLRKLNEDW